ncbi:hypothetical protein V8B55DRAFT_1561039 [Mucor lusitanicus]
MYETADYYYRCDMCNAKMESLRSVLEHRKSVHNIDANRSTNRKKIKHIDEEPDRAHLRRAHFMILERLSIRKPSTSGSVPDPDDPSLYCKACNRKYKSKQYYKSHCRFVHGIVFTKSGHPRSVPAAVKNVSTYCQLCNKHLSSKRTFYMHLFRVHKEIERPTRIQKPKDTEDPSNFCRACQKTYCSRFKYRVHLRLVHQMVLPSLVRKSDPNELPDPWNRHHYCSVCRKTYASSAAYRIHCRTTHFMFYCAQCENRFRSRCLFQMHLKQAHSPY